MYMGIFSYEHVFLLLSMMLVTSEALLYGWVCQKNEPQ